MFLTLKINFNEVFYLEQNSVYYLDFMLFLNKFHLML